jgi:hypothetical protein
MNAALLFFGMTVTLMGCRPRRAALGRDGRPRSIIIVSTLSFFVIDKDLIVQGLETDY